MYFVLYNKQGSFVTGVLSAGNTCVHSSFTFRGALWRTLMSNRGTLASNHTATVPITVPTRNVPIVNCTYGHQPPITLYLRAKFQLHICCTS